MMIQNDTKIKTLKHIQTWRLLGNPPDRFKVFFSTPWLISMKRRRCGHAGGKVTLLGRFEVIIVELERKHA